MKRLLFTFLAYTILISCNESSPKINHEIKVDTVATVDDIVRDSTKVLVSELPIKFDSTDVLLYAVGMVDLQKRGGYSKFSSGSYSSSEIGSSYFNRDDFRGDFFNIIFIDNSGKRLLTKNEIKIKQGIFLRQIYNMNKVGYILYTIYDRDTNGDKTLDNNDVEALYISNVDGTKFTKLTNELHEFYDYQLLKDDRKLYFRTLEDINKDGKLNNNDKFHYYFIDFISDNYSVKEYNPLDIFE